MVYKYLATSQLRNTILKSTFKVTIHFSLVSSIMGLRPLMTSHTLRGRNVLHIVKLSTSDVDNLVC